VFCLPKQPKNPSINKMIRLPWLPLKLRKQQYFERTFAVLVILLLVGLTYLSLRPAGEGLEVIESTPEKVIEGPVLSESLPTRLRIPKISVDTTFVEPLGLAQSGEVAVPDSDTEVGWYQYSPTPGELGPAVVLGHVDSYTGPAVFFYLGQVEPGDDIYIDREDGSTAHFVVEALERPKQSEFPTARVYGNLNYAGLRLITCSGIYERGKQRYTHNLVVYAKLVE
jgi:sortase (surface protein transpeptidase)